MFKATEGSTRHLLQLCFAYFVFYVITGLTVKYYLGSADKGLPGMQGFEFLAYSTLGGVLIASGIAIGLRWYRFASQRLINVVGFKIPLEFFYIIPSGICTGVVIPTTTIMYSLPISVMVAMVIMRGAVIIISRAVDEVQIRQGILHKKVYAEENIAVLFSVFAIAVHMLWANEEGGFEFLGSVVAVTTLISYILAYSFRIYIMNYYKNTAGKGVTRDNRSFFAIEQFAAVATLIVATILVFNSPQWFGWQVQQVIDFRKAIIVPHANWLGGMLAGTAFGLVSFFSVFIFMFKGRTATFAGLVNRLTSLVAGTAATLLFWFFFNGRFPSLQDWLSLGFILVAVWFLSRSEKRRAAELIATHEIEVDEPQTEEVSVSVKRVMV